MFFTSQHIQCVTFQFQHNWRRQVYSTQLPLYFLNSPSNFPLVQLSHTTNTSQKQTKKSKWQTMPCLLQTPPAGSVQHCCHPRTTKTWSCWERSSASTGSPLTMSWTLGVGYRKDKHTTGQFTDEQQTLYPCLYVKRDGNQKAIPNKTAWEVTLTIFKTKDDWRRTVANFLNVQPDWTRLLCTRPPLFARVRFQDPARKEKTR